MSTPPITAAFLAVMAEADMGDPAAFDERLRKATVTALHAIPGLSGMVARVTRRDRAKATFEVGVTGWSPTLHEVGMTRTVTLPRTKDAAAACVEEVGTILDLLERRSIDGDRLGLDGPERVSTFPDPARLHIDLALARMRATPTSCRNGVASAVRRIHEPSRGRHRISSRMSDREMFVAEHTGADGTIREAGWTMAVSGTASSDRSVHATYDGHILSFKAPPVPTTVRAAMLGRPLCDLVRIHPGIDQYVVKTMHVDQLEPQLDLYTVLFERTLVPLATLDWEILR